MKKRALEIDKEIVKKRGELNTLIEKCEDEEKIYEKSIELDVLIMEYLKCECK